MFRHTWIDSALLEHVSGLAAASPRRRKNFNFHLSEEDAAHRLLNAIEPDSYIPPHRHLDPTKDETLVVVRGRLGAVVFDETGSVVDTAVLDPHGERGDQRPPRHLPHGARTRAGNGVFRGEGGAVPADRAGRASTVGTDGRGTRGTGLPFRAA
jgi:cupin fold WbuC family metalloprotein